MAKDTAHRTHQARALVKKHQVAKATAHTAHQPCSPVSRSYVARDTAHATQHTERVHCRTGAKWPRIPHTQHNQLPHQ